MITIVSGYWVIDSKFDPSTYGKWMENSLSINAPYVFYTTSDLIPFIKKFRKYPTIYRERRIDDFYFKKYNFNEIHTNPSHCPSVELGLIWLEKIKLIQEVGNDDPYGNEWFAWIDAGVCTYRNKKAPIKNWPNIKKAEKLLKKECLNYTLSLGYMHMNINDLKKGVYQHRVSGTWIIHKNFVDRFANWFEHFLKIVMEEFKDKNQFAMLNDQVIWTRMMLDKPKLFNCIGEGYGEILNFLY